MEVMNRLAYGYSTDLFIQYEGAFSFINQYKGLSLIVWLLYIICINYNSFNNVIHSHCINYINVREYQRYSLTTNKSLS